MAVIKKSKCALCRKKIIDPGSVLLSSVKQDNFINWCKIMLNMDCRDVLTNFKQAWVCRYCIWDARFYHENNTESPDNCIWWNTDDALYIYSVEYEIRPCALEIKKLTNYQINKWVNAGQKRFACLVCGLLHGTQNAMFLHTLSKHPERKFNKCQLCGKYVDANIGMQAHLDEVHGEEISTSLKTNVLKCKFCTYIFPGQARKYSRSQHMKKCHSDIAVRCASFNCCRYFRTQTAMEKHAKEKHKNVIAREKLICIVCGEEFLNKQYMSTHVRRNHRHEVLFCPRKHCGMHFKTNKELQAHVKEVHENARNKEKTICKICTAKLQWSSFHGHMRQKHPEAFKCEKIVCRTYFKTKEEATEHFQATHHDKNIKLPNLFCDQCKFQTKWRHNLEMHVSAQHFPRTLKCPDCPKMLATLDHINEHARKKHIKKIASIVN